MPLRNSNAIVKGTFSKAAAGEGAAALNRVFEQYVVPIFFSSEQLHLHMAYNDVDPGASPIWYDEEGNVVAAALLAIRGKRCWIGGFGVAPEQRRKGHAAALLDTLIAKARLLGCTAMQLEVLENNVPAIAVYERAGFRRIRRLRSFEWRGPKEPNPRRFSLLRPEDLLDEPDSSARPCWQRERATLRNGAASTALSDGLGNSALFRYNAKLAQGLRLQAQSCEDLNALAAAIASLGPSASVLVLNEPEESGLLAFFEAGEWNEPFVQYEMLLTLSP